ncbi:MAG: 23S rRNA (adenine(2503)-C(2))-methyltransferase RlmN [Candidatus Bipolaricaulaceae bacterium]
MAGVDLRDLSFDQLVALLTGWGEPAFRAKQIWRWAWGRLAEEFEEMTDLPRPLRDRLAADLRLDGMVAVGDQSDADEGTHKVLLELADGRRVEAVLIRDGGRRTVCVSSQVGCPVGCPFCATGRMGFQRDLSPGEIAGQVIHFARRLRSAGERVTHVVVMGMGEPLLNYGATVCAVRNLNRRPGFGLGARRFTVSTVGVAPGMRRLAQEGLQVNLAVSLHAPDDELRRRLVPLDCRWPLPQVLAAADAYAQATGRRVTYEYVLLAGVNDAPGQARALGRLLRGRLAHVNLIPFNPAPGLPFAAPALERVEQFRLEVLRSGVDATVRRSSGVRIGAGCGQLGAGAGPLPGSIG